MRPLNEWPSWIMKTRIFKGLKLQIWQKHILKKLTTTFLFVLITLFAVYILVDLSAHGVRFLSKSNLNDVFIYYCYSISTLLDLFVTLGFLLSMLRVLHDLNSNREILALQMTGLSKRKILIPFFVFAGSLSLVCYANIQWLCPLSQDNVSTFKHAHKTKIHKSSENRLFTVSLDDESELIYQHFDRSKKELFGVFWVRSPSDIWHMKTLNISSLKGTFVNHLVRINRKLENEMSAPVMEFTDLPWNDGAILNKVVSFQCRPISTLFEQAFFTDSAEKRIIFSHLYYKLIVPLIPFLVLFSVSPSILSYSRNSPYFLVVAYSIFGFVSLKVILDGMLILGENQVIPSYVAILGPIILVLACSLPKFARMQ